jgi:selenocysteine-specific elongation factor
VIIGTAGHIDHGKSALVTALTGRPMDRLAEERRRGITIELNFAPLEFEGMPPIGMVDVPGHEDFVRTMVAGASGIDLVLLVVDAAEGIRPQTLEHLAIAEQLAVPTGIPVITKADLVEEDWLGLVEADLSDRLARSPIPFEQPAVVSAVTGRGIAELRERLRVLSASPPLRVSVPDLFRLPIDRVFPMAGIGTVVTGTVWTGTIAVGDTVAIKPGDRTARVRSVESFGRPADRALPGARVALGLTGVERSDVGRGQMVLEATARWVATTVLDVRFRLLPGAPASIGTRSRVRVHHGTAEIMARVYPRDRIEPGAEGPARLVLEAAVVARGGDRIVIRRYSPVTTIGGGVVMDPWPPRRSPWPEGLWSEVPDERLLAMLSRRQEGISDEELPILLGFPPSEAHRVAEGTAGVRAIGNRWILAARFDRDRTMMVERLTRFHQDEPAAPGLSLETLRSMPGVSPSIADEVMAELLAEEKVKAFDGVVALATFRPRSRGGDAEVGKALSALDAAGLEPPTVTELGIRLGLEDAAGALRIAASQGLVEAVERERYFSRAALETFVTTLRKLGERNAEIVPAALRDRLGLSRKFLIPLLEWADRKGITRRDEGGKRWVKQ